MRPSFTTKILPISVISKDETITSVIAIQANNNNNIGSYIQSSQDNDKHPNDITMITEIISNLDPYSLTFNIKTSFTLSIDDEYCPYYTQGFNLLHESRTSKSYTQCTVLVLERLDSHGGGLSVIHNIHSKGLGVLFVCVLTTDDLAVFSTNILLLYLSINI